MQINSNCSALAFEARFKLNSANVEKIKQATINSIRKPNTQRAFAATGLSLAGTASIVSGYNVTPDKLAPSVQSSAPALDSLPPLGTTVSEIPMTASLGGSINELSGTHSSQSAENSLFGGKSIGKSGLFSAEKLEKYSMLMPNNYREQTVLPFLASAASAMYSGIAPAENVESLISGFELANTREESLLAGVATLVTPLATFASSDGLSSSKKILENKGIISEKSDNDKKIPS